VWGKLAWGIAGGLYGQSGTTGTTGTQGTAGGDRRLPRTAVGHDINPISTTSLHPLGALAGILEVIYKGGQV